MQYQTMNRIRALIIKETLHILRDPTSLLIVFLMPILMIIIYGYCINFDLNNVNAGIIDLSNGENSKKLIKKFINNRYFTIEDLKEKYSDPLKEGEKLLKAGGLKEIIIIPADFSKKIEKGRKTEIGIILDGSDSNVANLIYQYNELILLDFQDDFQNLNNFLKIRTKVLFNPDVKSSFFFIPGLIAVLLLMITTLLTSLTISREKESGSIELIFISPLKSFEIILGKTIPYIFVSLIVEILILLSGKILFNIPFRGNIMVLFVFSILYIITGLSLGILISTIASTQEIAMFVTLLTTLLPSIMLSGFIFPLDSLHPILKGFSYIVPATYFLKIIRGVVVKGAEIKHFIFEGIILTIFPIVLITISNIKFSKIRKRSK